MQPKQIISQRTTIKQVLWRSLAFLAVTATVVWLVTGTLTMSPTIPAMAATPTKTATTGNWNASGTWTPAGVPGNNEIVLIPAGRTVTVRGTDHTMNGTILIIEGQLSMETTCNFCFDYGSLTFTGANSGVIIEDGGRVTDDSWFGGDTHFVRVQ